MNTGYLICEGMRFNGVVTKLCCTSPVRTNKTQNDTKIISTKNNCVSLCGSFSLQASLVRSASRNDLAPTNRFLIYGFRLARTLPP